MSDQVQFIVENLPNLLIGFPGQRPGGLILSVALAALAGACGFAIANLINIGSATRFRPAQWLCTLYVELFRGLPILLLLVLVYQVAPRGFLSRGIGIELSPRNAAVIALTLYSGAYQAEILRAGLATVPDQLVDSARSLGSTPWVVFRTVRLRYALRIMLPAFTGQAISLFKDTSVVVIIGVADLMTSARVALGADVTHAPYWMALYLTVGMLYFAIAFPISRVARRWEKRHTTDDLVHSLANY